MVNPTPLPLPMQDAQYDSRKSRAALINMMAQVNNDGSFRAIVKREGSVKKMTLDGSAGSTLHIANDGDMIFCSDLTIYKSGADGVPSTIGPRSSPAGIFVTITNNNRSAGAEYMFPYASGAGDVYTEGGAIVAITDPNYTAKNPRIGAQLGGRTYMVDTVNENQFFCCGELDTLTWDALAFATADEISGNLVAVAPNKSSLWLFCSQNIELWQIYKHDVFPIRRVQGASIRTGLINAFALDQLYEWTGFVGSDNRVYLLDGTNMSVISDINFAQLVETSAGQKLDYVAFFVDGPDHKYFCVTSYEKFGLPFREFTWVYDIKTGMSHIRKSPGSEYWHARSSAYVTEALESVVFYSMCTPFPAIPDQDVIFESSPLLYDDDGTDFECVIQTGSVSYPYDTTIESIEVEMETGVGNTDSPNPVMGVEYSKDGGVNWTTWGDTDMGVAGDTSNRIVLNNFGRLIRRTDFVLRLTVSEPVRWEVYGIAARISEGF